MQVAKSNEIRSIHFKWLIECMDMSLSRCLLCFIYSFCVLFNSLFVRVNTLQTQTTTRTQTFSHNSHSHIQIVKNRLKKMIPMNEFNVAIMINWYTSVVDFDFPPHRHPTFPLAFLLFFSRSNNSEIIRFFWGSFSWV